MRSIRNVRRLGDAKGANLVEAAIVTPLLILLTLGIVDGPVDVPDAGDVGALLAAAESDGQVAAGDHVAGEWLRPLTGGVEAEVLEGAGDLGVDPFAGFGPGGEHANVQPSFFGATLKIGGREDTLGRTMRTHEEDCG